MWQITQWYSGTGTDHLQRKSDTSYITCNAGLFMVSSRRPALVATAGLTSSTAVRKQQKACAREYFSRWFLVTEWISRNLQITATFSTAMENTKDEMYRGTCYTYSENWTHREKVNSGPPHGNFKHQREILRPPLPAWPPLQQRLFPLGATPFCGFGSSLDLVLSHV